MTDEQDLHTIISVAFVLYIQEKENLNRNGAMLRAAEMCTALEVALEEQDLNEISKKAGGADGIAE